ncbi:MAG: site-specific DNA-methyltransferase [Endomicrobiales bacterium]|nr:site-specific DNA-methyltransferase [Endomicrobiales bacterium]
MSKIQKLDLKTKSITDDEKAKLKSVLPYVFSEGSKIDFDKLKTVLGEDVDTGEERFGMQWPGKAECFKVIQEPSIATLKPCKNESVDWDTTENLFIEGDNLEVLKQLQKSYYGKVKMIYIDPPYNTGNDFIYPDNYSESLDTYLAYTGQIDSQGKKFSTNTESEGRFHSKWMNMMYPRLFLARNLLRDDGVIFVSIDDNEVDNLKKIMNDIFGESNYVDVLKWKRKKQPSFLATHTAKVMEYIMVYAKVKGSLEKLSIEGTSDSTKKVINVSNKESKRHFSKNVRIKIDGKGVIKKGRYTIKTMDVEYLQDVHYDNNRTLNEVTVISKFTVSQENIYEFIDNDLLFITAQKGLRRDVSQEEIGKRKSITDLLLSEWGDNQESENELKAIFGTGDYFDYLKSIKLIGNLVKSCFSENQIILDFFAGSATTAHSVLNLNAEDAQKRKFILVQLPEILTEDSKAFKDGYKTISDIGKERIRRVIKKIKEEKKEKAKNKDGDLFKDKQENNDTLDLGFKVFKLDKSNFKIWDENVDEKVVEKQIELAIDHIDPKSTELDLLYEILLKSGFELTTSLKELKVEGKKVYSVSDGALLICLENKLTKELIREIAKLEPARVVCKDSGFEGNDQLKTNAVQIMKSFKVESFRTI